MKALRLPLIILSLLCVVFLLFAVQQFMGREQEKKTRLVTEKTLEETMLARDQAQKELDDQKRLRADLESQLTEVKTSVSSLQDKAERLAAQIADEKRAKEDAVAQLSEKSKEADELRANYESEKRERLSLQEQYEKIKKEFSSVQEQLKTAKVANENLTKQLEELQANKEVQLDKIVVKPGVDAEGKVLVVNREFNFIVVAAGNNKGITPGVTFGIYRDKKLIGKAQVEKVYETMSAANIMPDSAEIREGDIAKAM